MKAEHRKELQTNVLADRVGRLVQTVKAKPTRKGFLVWALVIAALVGLVAWRWVAGNRARTTSNLWVALDTAPDMKTLQQLLVSYPTYNQGKAAQFQYVWYFFWDEGLKTLGSANAKRALENIKGAKELYEKLGEATKKDPVLGPEALYQVAVAEEALAALEKDVPSQLQTALARYKEVTEAFPKSARAAQAKKRIEELEQPESRQKVERFYSDLRTRLQFFNLPKDLGQPPE